MDTSFIKSFFLEKELDDFVVNLIFEEFQKPGLILLPSGNTFEKSIYPRVDELFSQEEYNTFDSRVQDTKTHSKQNQVNKDLKLSHLDELIPTQITQGVHLFANAIKESLPNVMSQLSEDFYEIDIKDSQAFFDYLRLNAPRVMFMGLGSDPVHAHVAFIGEEFINTDISKITLSEALQETHQAKHAITIGTDLFQSNSLEHIYVVAKGETKAESIQAALEDDTTGLGYLIANHKDKLSVFADNEALKLIS